MSSKICFQSNTFVTSIMIIVISLIGLIAYIKYTEDYKISTILNNSANLVKNNINAALNGFSKSISSLPVKIGTEDMYPEIKYINQHENSGISQNIGYIFNPEGARFPLFEEKRNRNFYYYIKDDSRNGIKIPINDTDMKHSELYDSDIVKLDNTDFTIKKYNYLGNRY